MECQSKNHSIDDRLGELVCDDCGLVLVTEPFEQTSYAYNADGIKMREAWKITPPSSVKNMRNWGRTDRALHAGITMCKILLSSLVNTRSLSERVDKLYYTLYRKHVFSTTSLEDRSAALVYYVLRESNLPYTLKEVCKEYDCSEKRVFKLAKKIARQQNNIGVFLMSDSSTFAEKYALGLGNGSFVSKVGRIATHYDNLILQTEDNLRPSSPVAFCYIVSVLENMNISQQVIAEHTGFSTRTIYKETTRLLQIKNTNKKEIEGKGIEWIEIY